MDDYELECWINLQTGEKLSKKNPCVTTAWLWVQGLWYLEDH